MTQTAQDSSTVAPETSSPPVTTAATATPSITTVPAPAADPVIGNWIGYQYIASGRVEKTWVIRENHTWSMTNRNVKSDKKKVVNGTWRKNSATSYTLIPPDGAPDPFTYDPVTDRLSDEYFKGTYYRYSGTVIPATRPPTLNVTVNSARFTSGICNSHPFTGKIFIVLDVTVANINETNGYTVTDSHSIILLPDDREMLALNQRLAEQPDTLFPSVQIGTGASRQGILVFSVPESSGTSFRLKFVDNNKNPVSGIIPLEIIRTNGTSS